MSEDNPNPIATTIPSEVYQLADASLRLLLSQALPRPIEQLRVTSRPADGMLRKVALEITADPPLTADENARAWRFTEWWIAVLGGGRPIVIPE